MRTFTDISDHADIKYMKSLFTPCCVYLAEVTLPKSRPPTESKNQVERSGLLDRVHKGTPSKPDSICFFDGNKAWMAGAKMLACLLHVKFYFLNIDFTIIIPSFAYFVNINLTSNTGRRNDMDILLRKRKLLARQVIHQDKIYAKTLRSIPRHLSQVAGTQRIDRH